MWVLLLLPLFVTSQGSFRKVDNDAFERGEYLKYRVFYDSWLTSWLTAGYGTMEIAPDWETVNGRKAYHITVHGYSVGLFNLFYKVRDRFESYLDRDGLMSLRFIRRTREGGYVRNDDVYFDHQKLEARSIRAVKEITPYVQDMVSAFYYVRAWDFEDAKVNDKYYLDFFLDDSLYHSEIIFLGKETLRTEFGSKDCLRFKPRVATGELFQEQYPMELWVTDDRNKIPVMIRSAVIIGSVRIELVEYKGLKWKLGER
ncbi:MAG: DUF3108 domain-containing protein [Bacteroidales bacterium]|nr:DUF3108 domain-containing protein [Bacteroidales bacterium]